MEQWRVRKQSPLIQERRRATRVDRRGKGGGAGEMGLVRLTRRAKLKSDAANE